MKFLKLKGTERKKQRKEKFKQIEDVKENGEEKQENLLKQYVMDKKNSQLLIAEKSVERIDKVKEAKKRELYEGCIFPPFENEPKMEEIDNYTTKNLSCGSLISYRLLPNKNVAEVVIGFKGGARFGKIGLAHLTEHMVLKKAEYKLQSVREDLALNDVSISAGTTMRGIRFNLKCKSEQVEKYVKLICDLIDNDEFDEQVFEKEKKIILNEKRMSRDKFLKKPLKDRFELEHSGIMQVFDYVIGDEKDLRAIKLSDVIEYKRKYFNLQNLVVVADLQKDYAKFYNCINENLLKKLPKAKGQEEIASNVVEPYIKDEKRTYQILKTRGETVDVMVSLKRLGMGKDCVSEGVVIKNVAKFFLENPFGVNRQRLRDEEGLCYGRFANIVADCYMTTLQCGANCVKDDVRKVIIMQLNILKDLLKNGMDENQFAIFKKHFLESNKKMRATHHYYLSGVTVFDYCAGNLFITNKQQADIYDRIEAMTVEEMNKLLRKFYENAELQVLVCGDVTLSQLPSVPVLNSIFKSTSYDKMSENMAEMSAEDVEKEIKIYKSNYDLSEEQSLKDM